MSIQLKVNRLELITRLEAARVTKQTQYEKDLKEYETEVKTKTKTAISELKKKLAKGKISFGYSGASVSVSGVKIKKSKPANPKLDGLDGLISKLKMATNEILTVSDKSDYFRYL